MTIKAIDYGIYNQMIRGKKPLLDTLPSYKKWEPTPLEKRLVALRAEQLFKANPFSNITSRLVDWNCIRMQGDKRIGQHQMRIYGDAFGKANQIARITTPFAVVNERAVAWAAKNTNKMVTQITNETRAALQVLISDGIKQGKSMYTIGREIRPLIGLNATQAGAVAKIRDKLIAGGIKNVDKKIAREVRKRIIYRGEMIARTETARAMSAGTLEGYAEATVRRVRFEASADACEVCSFLDGNKYTVHEADGLIPVHPNCTPDPTTRIATKNGPVPIACIKVGDMVMTHKDRYRRVTQIHHTPNQMPQLVTLCNGKSPEAIRQKKDVNGNFIWADQSSEIVLTANHPIFVNNGWKPIKDVCFGDRLLMFDAQFHLVSTCVGSIEKHTTDTPVMLFNLSVEEDESYIANGFVVHNCRCTFIPIMSSRTKVKR